MLSGIGAFAKILRQAVSDEKEYKGLKSRDVTFDMPVETATGSGGVTIDEKVTVPIPLNRGVDLFDPEIWRELQASRSKPFFKYRIMDDGARYYEIYEHDIPFIRDIKTYLNFGLFIERLTREETTWAKAFVSKAGLLQDAYRIYGNYVVFNSTDSVIGHHIQYAKKQYLPRFLSGAKQLYMLMSFANMKRGMHYGFEKVIAADKFAEEYQLSLQPFVKKSNGRPSIAMEESEKKALDSFNSQQQSGVFASAVAAMDAGLQWKYGPEFGPRFHVESRKELPGNILELRKHNSAGDIKEAQLAVASSHWDITFEAQEQIANFRNSLQRLQDVTVEYDKGLTNALKIASAAGSAITTIRKFNYRAMAAAEIQPRLNLLKDDLKKLRNTLIKLAGTLNYYEDEFCLRDGFLINKFFAPLIESYCECLAVLNVEDIDYIQLKNLFRTERVIAREKNHNGMLEQVKDLEEILAVRDTPLGRAPHSSSYPRPFYEQPLRLFNPIVSLAQSLYTKPNPAKPISEVSLRIWELLLAHIDKYTDDISVDDRDELKKYRNALNELVQVKKLQPPNPNLLKQAEKDLAKHAKAEQLVMNALYKRKLHLSKQANMIRQRINHMKSQQLQEKTVYYVDQKMLANDKKLLSFSKALDKCYGELHNEFTQWQRELEQVHQAIKDCERRKTAALTRRYEIEQLLEKQEIKNDQKALDLKVPAENQPFDRAKLTVEKNKLSDEIQLLKSELGRKNETLELERKIEWRAKELSFLHEAKHQAAEAGIERTVKFLRAKKTTKDERVPSLSPQMQVMLAEIQAMNEEPTDYFSPMQKVKKDVDENVKQEANDLARKMAMDQKRQLTNDDVKQIELQARQSVYMRNTSHAGFNIRSEKYESAVLNALQQRTAEINLESKCLVGQAREVDEKIHQSKKIVEELMSANQKLEAEQKQLAASVLELAKVSKDEKAIAALEAKNKENAATIENNKRDISARNALVQEEELKKVKYKHQQDINEEEKALFSKLVTGDEKGRVTVDVQLLRSSHLNLTPQTLIMLHEIDLVKKLYERDRTLKGMSTAVGSRVKAAPDVSTNLILGFMDDSKVGSNQVKCDEKSAVVTASASAGVARPATSIASTVDEAQLNAYLHTLFQPRVEDSKLDAAAPAVVAVPKAL